MDVKAEEKPDVKPPLPQRNGGKFQNDNGGDKPNAHHNQGHNRGNFHKGGPRGGGRGGFAGQQRGEQRGRNQGNQANRNNEEFVIMGRLKQLAGPTHDIPPIDQQEVKFCGRNRLYVGNLTSDITDDELRELFRPYGEVSEIFINKEKNFAFLKLDYHANAEKAKRELDSSTRKNRQLRIRFAPNATCIKVKNISPFVSNELLRLAFEIFGPIERSVVIVDDRGKPTGEGFIEFARKQSATSALKYCTERCFFLTASLRPCVVEMMEQYDDTDGLPDKNLPRKNQEFFKEREIPPRFADNGSFEDAFGTKWKQLHELYKQKHEALKAELIREELKLEAEMSYARFENETEMLRNQLRQREMDRDRHKSEWEKKQQMAEEQRTRDEMSLKRQQEAMAMKMERQEEELRRRQQENTLFMQAQQLNSLLDQQELNQNRNFDGPGNDNHGRRSFDMMNQQNSQDGYIDYNHGRQNNRFDQDAYSQQGPQRGGGQNRIWINNNRGGNDDFPNNQNKRRRF